MLQGFEHYKVIKPPYFQIYTELWTMVCGLLTKIYLTIS